MVQREESPDYPMMSIIEYWNGSVLEGYGIADDDCGNGLKDEEYYTYLALRQAAGTEYNKLLYMAVTFDDASDRIVKTAYFRNFPLSDEEAEELKESNPNTTFLFLSTKNKDTYLEIVQENKNYRIVPISFADAKDFIGENHRHNSAVAGGKFAIAVENPAGEVLGVATCGRPVSRILQQKRPLTLEITRVCSLGGYNVCSMLYGRCVKIAKDLGYEEVITYTLPSESGASLRAAGFAAEDEHAGGKTGWNGKRSARNDSCRKDKAYRFPEGEKIRWSRSTA